MQRKRTIVQKFCIQVILERKVKGASTGGAGRVLPWGEKFTPKALTDKDTRKAIFSKVKWSKLRRESQQELEVTNTQNNELY